MINSTRICWLKTTAPDDSVTTWQSAFWGIIIIAMNSILQDNGMVLGLPSTWGMALRSSPIVCLFDALELTASWLIFIIFNADYPRTAARRVAVVRFRDATGNNGGQTLSKLRDNFWVIQVVFIIGTLTQVIKIFACTGMPGTQLSAAFCLFSWTVSQALVLAAGSNWTSAELTVLQGEMLQDVASQGCGELLLIPLQATYHHLAWIDVLLQVLLNNGSKHIKQRRSCLWWPYTRRCSWSTQTS